MKNARARVRMRSRACAHVHTVFARAGHVGSASLAPFTSTIARLTWRVTCRNLTSSPLVRPLSDLTQTSRQLRRRFARGVVNDIIISTTNFSAFVCPRLRVGLNAPIDNAARVRVAAEGCRGRGRGGRGLLGLPRARRVGPLRAAVGRLEPWRRMLSSATRAGPVQLSVAAVH